MRASRMCCRVTGSGFVSNAPANEWPFADGLPVVTNAPARAGEQQAQRPALPVEGTRGGSPRAVWPDGSGKAVSALHPFASG